MPYQSVLNLIDAELERLFAARRLLLDEPEEDDAGFAADEAAAETAQTASDALEAQPAQEPQSVTVRRIAARAQRQSSGVRRRRAHGGQTAEPGALSGSIPSSPVAVSAARVSQSRETESQERAHHAPASKPEVAAGEGTLEALLKDLRARGSAA